MGIYSLRFAYPLGPDGHFRPRRWPRRVPAAPTTRRRAGLPGTRARGSAVGLPSVGIPPPPDTGAAAAPICCTSPKQLPRLLLRQEGMPSHFGSTTVVSCPAHFLWQPGASGRAACELCITDRQHWVLGNNENIKTTKKMDYDDIWLGVLIGLALVLDAGVVGLARPWPHRRTSAPCRTEGLKYARRSRQEHPGG
jgi:hypothetical protein